ncbi:hypothetical protein SAMN04489867_2823 [Pedococcus dokdonensis]|uniref:Uncharacterized protein n=1 Tax=Pedococcus dokdonensis TaxID=443156 RepID=A0A1H0THX6_9MICO|nr:protein kinase family protein [Pedococcus dokdonensis]SDP53574.1 hypothetical protein SAMN04489867_2823 [Pedococcus dokdonensis]
MHGVGPSTVLGGRYAVQRRLEQLPRAERWSAHDTTLERDVVIVCFSEQESHADTTLDAARRAAGLDNSRLVRVLDVGRSDGIAFFVEESIPDAQTLAHLLEQGGLPAEEVRRIAGETATGLEAARGRGLHHLRLTPHSVLRAHDGTIKVRGVATTASMTTDEEVDASRAARTDAVGVVAVTYAALTSRWPLPGSVPGLESAPRVVGGVPAPSEIAAGVPGDLDALCRLTLNEDQGPLTPGDFATQIAPWAMTQVQGFAGSRRADDDSTRTIAMPVADLDAAFADPALVDPGFSDAAFAEAAAQVPPPPVPPDEQTTPDLAPVDAPTTEVLAPSGADEPTPTRPIAAGAAQPEAAPGPPAGAVPPGATVDPDQPGAGAAAAAQAAAAASAVGSALGTAGQAAGQAAGAAAQRFGSFARATADKAAERRAQRQAAADRAEQRRISLNQALVEGEEPLDAPLPLLSADRVAPPSRDQTKIVLAIVATFLVVVTVVAAIGASKIGSKSDLGLGGSPTPRGTQTVTAPAVTVPPTGADDSGDTGGGGDPYAILSATGFDPEGDGAERNGEAARTFDGKDNTYWSSEGYASPNLGGLKKGVGLRLDLGNTREVHTVKLVLPNAADVSVLVGEDRDSMDSASQVGASKGKSGEITLTAPAAVKGQYVFIWFTAVTQVADGRFRATVAEVTVS